MSRERIFIRRDSFVDMVDNILSKIHKVRQGNVMPRDQVNKPSTALREAYVLGPRKVPMVQAIFHSTMIFLLKYVQYASQLQVPIFSFPPNMDVNFL